MGILNIKGGTEGSSITGFMAGETFWERRANDWMGNEAKITPFVLFQQIFCELSTVECLCLCLQNKGSMLFTGFVRFTFANDKNISVRMGSGIVAYIK